MANFNRVFLIGNLTRDPELRYTPNGTAVSNLRIAVNRKFKTQSGEVKEETAFVTVVTWGKQAETCNQFLAKGRSVFVEGRLQTRSWETQDGQKRNVMEVRASRIQFLGGGRAANESAQAQGKEESMEALLADNVEKPAVSNEGSSNSEEVPF